MNKRTVKKKKNAKSFGLDGKITYLSHWTEYIILYIIYWLHYYVHVAHYIIIIIITELLELSSQLWLAKTLRRIS